jgi:hypothetical protein
LLFLSLLYINERKQSERAPKEDRKGENMLKRKGILKKKEQKTREKGVTEEKRVTPNGGKG